MVCVVGTGHRRTRRSWHRGLSCSCRVVLSECGVLCGEKVGGCGRRMSHCSSLSSRPARLQRRPDLTLPKLGDKHNGAERQDPNPFLPLFTTTESYPQRLTAILQLSSSDSRKEVDVVKFIAFTIRSAPGQPGFYVPSREPSKWLPRYR